MSGARALAAARARRAGGSNNSQSQSNPPPPPKPTQQSNEKPVSNKMNPALMLFNHNKIIENLQSIITDLTEKVNNQEKSTKDMLNSLNLDDNNIVYFKKKLEKLEKDLNDIKKYILKVQTFSMESSLQCSDMKRRIEIIEQKLGIDPSNSNKNLDFYNEDSELNNTVDSLISD